ncbi:MAG: alkaline phosphatase D family protein, partial [Pseudomonadales bacterium]|nr:alkaline phosphatase D family protein [Pseudomonadales bacterium]
LATTTAATALSGCAVGTAGAGATTGKGSNPVFQHGIASGDPLADRVMLWTRISTADSSVVPVRWLIASDAALKNVVNQGVISALPERDHTVKVDAVGLQPGRTYYYRFDAAGEASPIGRTRTLPEKTASRLRFAVVSCSNFPFGYFNAYGRVAERDDLDAVLHLGDYFYEYAPGEYGNGAEYGRSHLPAREVISLSDYRTRHAQYKTDPDLQEAHRLHPWICVWDDHESANNSWRDGAENHNPDLGEGDWPARRAAAIQAYHEWLPIREQPSANGPFIYRSFRFGSLADLIMLDTRLYGRTKQLDDRKDRSGLKDPARTILGADQQAWLAEQLRASKRNDRTWRLLGQQLMFAQLLDEEGVLLNVDQWDGYPASRDAVLDQLAAEHIDNTVILTGDIHSAWAMDIARDPYSSAYDPSSGRGSLAVELVTTSVTSPGPWREAETVAERERELIEQRPHIHYVNLREHGYLLLDIDSERARGEFWMVDTISRRSSGQRLATAYVTENGANHLVKDA